MTHQALRSPQILVAGCAQGNAEEVAIAGERFDPGLEAPTDRETGHDCRRLRRGGHRFRHDGRRLAGPHSVCDINLSATFAQYLGKRGIHERGLRSHGSVRNAPNEGRHRGLRRQTRDLLFDFALVLVPRFPEQSDVILQGEVWP